MVSWIFVFDYSIMFWLLWWAHSILPRRLSNESVLAELSERHAVLKVTKLKMSWKKVFNLTFLYLNIMYQTIVHCISWANVLMPKKSENLSKMDNDRCNFFNIFTVQISFKTIRVKICFSTRLNSVYEFLLSARTSWTRNKIVTYLLDLVNSTSQIKQIYSITKSCIVYFNL